MGQIETRNADLAAVDLRALGARIRALRNERGLTQGELAGAKLSTGYVSRIESGGRRPTMKVLIELADRLGATTDQLLHGIESSAYDEVRLGLDYAEIALESGDSGEAESHARQALAAAEAGHVASFVARGAYLLGRALEARGAFDEAITRFEQVVAGSPGLPQLEAGIALSRCLRDSGDLSLAIEAGEQVEAAIADTPLAATEEAVQLSVTIAAAYAERGDLSRATRRCTAAIATAEGLSSPKARAAAYWNASVVEAAKGRTTAAAPLAARALALLSEGRDERNLARLRLQLGRLLLQTDPPELATAIEHALRAREDLEHTSATSVDLAFCDVTLAQAHLLAGDPGAARELAERCLAQAPTEAALPRVEATVVLGQVAASEGDAVAARESYQAAAQLLSAVGADRSAAQVWYELAELLEEVEEYDGARAAFRSAAAATGLAARRPRVAATPITRR